MLYWGIVQRADLTPAQCQTHGTLIKTGRLFPNGRCYNSDLQLVIKYIDPLLVLARNSFLHINICYLLFQKLKTKKNLTTANRFTQVLIDSMFCAVIYYGNNHQYCHCSMCCVDQSFMLQANHKCNFSVPVNQYIKTPNTWPYIYIKSLKDSKHFLPVKEIKTVR